MLQILKARRAAAKITDEVNKQKAGSCLKIHVHKLDLSSQKDVRRFVREVTKDFPAINILINNAGMAGSIDESNTVNPRSESVDGHEMIMATNYFG